MNADMRLIRDRFPRSSRYNPDWVVAGVSGASNPLWLTEWLTQKLTLEPGMRVLDLGCGRGISSIFLCREFGVQVWAADLWFDSAERLQRVRDAGVEHAVFPIHADARSLPFPTEFFDAVVSIDSFYYFGTDDLYLNYIARFLKPGGRIGVAQAGVIEEIDSGLPEHLQTWWAADQPYLLHSAAWWHRHWSRTGIVDVDAGDTLDDGWRLWLEWLEAVAPENTMEIQAIQDDHGRHVGYIRVVGRLQRDARVAEPVVAVETKYLKRPLLRADM